MMLYADVVAVSPSSIWRVLQRAGLLSRWRRKPSRKGTGFEQPPHAHQHWHIDVSYINVSGTFYYLCSVLDGYSRSIFHWELQESMTEAEIEVILLLHPHTQSANDWIGEHIPDDAQFYSESRTGTGHAPGSR